MNVIYVLNQNLEIQGVVDEYISAIWRPSYSEVGDFQLYLSADAKAVGLLQKNWYLVRSHDIGVSAGVVTYRKVMIIKNFEISTSVEVGDFLTVTGRELKHILHQRIVWQQTTLSGTVEDGVRQLIDENAISPADANRILPKVKFAEAASVLPEGYTQLTHIESSGTQYIDTGFMPNQDTKVVMHYHSSGIPSERVLFGARTAYKNTSYSIWIQDSYFQTDYGNNANKLSVDTTGDVIVTKDKAATSLNTSASTYTSAAATFQCAYTMYLFTLNQAGSAHASMASIKLYSCRIYDNGTLIRDFIPAKNTSGTVGLYDVVNGSFYTNAGSGTFSGGYEVASSGITETIDKQITGDYLDEAITDICTTHDIGWDAHIEGTNIVFEVYKGTDRSYGQTEVPYVVFSDEFENLYNTTYQLQSEEFANMTKIGGEGEGVERKFATVGDELAGFDRFETFTDARDISQNADSDKAIPEAEYILLLQERGRENLASLSITEGFSGEILSDVAFEYERDFFIGDLVTVVNRYGITRDVRVLSAIESEDEGGTKLVPQFNI